MAKKERYLVTAALPYANGPVHVGHAIGCYIPADVYTRYLRLSGADVLYICGTDEHGTPITVTAEAEGIAPKQVVEKYHVDQLRAFERLGIKFDNFSGTARPPHYELSQHFFKKALENGLLEKKTVERPYCPSCKRFLPDRYVKGTCPKCEAPDQKGDQCEKCGKQLEPHELIKPYCSICKTTPEHRETAHWFFKLSELAPKLEKWIAKECTNWPANARNFALGWLKEGLEDRAITRDLSWGIPVPAEGGEGKVLYVWFDAPIGYISSTREWAEKNKKGDEWKKYWTGDTKIVHFIGKDNIPFHTIIWPATLIAEGSYALPWQIASNEFLNLEGRKVSTSRGWVIWLTDILDEFDADAVRYYLISIAPETSDSDFHLKEFGERVNNELIATLGNFVNRTLTFIKNKNDGVVPEPAAFDKADEEFKKELEGFPKLVGEDLEKFQLKHALSRLLACATAGNQYFQKKEPWKKDPATTLYLSANLCRSLAILMYPFLPFSAEKIWEILNLSGSVSEQSWESAGELGVKPGQKIGEVKPLYKKIDDEDIKAFAEKYLHTKKEEVETIDYEYFKKVELRAGEVKSVEPHPSADKLYVLKVDLGDLGERQLVAGIKESYTPEELVGKQVIVVANLAPAKIRGVTSEGMLLAVDGEKPVLVSPEKKVAAGSKVL